MFNSTRRFTLLKERMKRGTSALWLTGLILLSSVYSSGQGLVVHNESFDDPAFPPSGWVVAVTSGSHAWDRSTGNITSPHTGAGMAHYGTFHGDNSILVTPSFKLNALQPGNTAKVRFWMYRDNNAAYGQDRVEVYINTSPNLTNATLVGTIYRSRLQPPSVPTVDWYNYEFDMPDSYHGSVNYLVFKAIANWGWNGHINVDDIEYEEYAAVLMSGSLSGVVTDNATGLPVVGAKVMLNDTTFAYTALDGSYGFDYGFFDVVPNLTLTTYKEGYTTQSTAFTAQTTPITVNIGITEQLNPPTAPLVATLNNSEVSLTWERPQASYEILYDDGSFENITAWMIGTNINALKFTPADYPCTVTGGSINIGDGSYPTANAQLLPFQVAVYDDNGTNGMPGTQLAVIDVTPTNWGWVSFSGLNVGITSGNFYIGMIQDGNFPDCTPIAVDETNPSMRSYSKFVTGNGAWAISGYQDFMIRAVVSGPGGPSLKKSFAGNFVNPSLNTEGQRSLTDAKHAGGVEGAGQINRLGNPDNIVEYQVYRILGDSSVLSNWTAIGTSATTSYTDNGWSSLPNGPYRWGVKTVYTANNMSDAIVSNAIGKNWESQVTVNLSLSSGFSPEGIEVTLTNADNDPEHSYTAAAPASGQIIFPSVWHGQTHIHIQTAGYAFYNEDFVVSGPVVKNILLQEYTPAPSGLYVDPLTLVATWTSPIHGYAQDFKDAGLPNKWLISDSRMACNGDDYLTMTSNNSINGRASAYYEADNLWSDGSFEFTVNKLSGNPTYSFGAFIRASGFPSTSGSTGYYVSINTSGYFSVYRKDGANETAIVSWTFSSLLEMGYNVDNKIRVVCSGSDFEIYINGGLAGTFSDATYPEGRFVLTSPDSHNGDVVKYDDYTWIPEYGQPGKGGTGVIGYNLFLDNNLAGYTTDTTFTYDPASVNWNQTYVASVKAVYASGLSDPCNYTFTSVFLPAPRNLTALERENHTVQLNWLPPVVPGTGKKSAIPYAPATQPVHYAGTNNMGVVETPGTRASRMPDPKVIEALSSSQAWAFMVYPDINLVTFDVEHADQFSVVSSIVYTTFSADFTRFDTINIYGISNSTNVFFKVNRQTGTPTTLGTITPPGSANWQGMACDKTTDVMYLAACDGTITKLYTLNTANATATFIADVYLQNVVDIAIDGNGQMYALDINSDMVYLVNKTTGEATPMASSIGFNANYAQGMSWDPKTDEIYLAAYNNDASEAELRVLDRSTGSTTLVGQMGDYEFDGLAFPGEAGAITPDNLTGYRIYRDGELVAEPGRNDVSYFDSGLIPGTYSYTITAMYDAPTPGESMIEGPVTITLNYGMSLPFEEKWESGNFSQNQWSTGQSTNWRINSQAGNTAPCAEFYWEPVQYNYADTLTSYFFWDQSEALSAKIYLDLDYMMDAQNYTGNERLYIQIWNETKGWRSVDSLDNSASAAWTSKHYDITRMSLGKIFQIRFIAKGVNSSNLNKWRIDNIHIYHDDSCDPVQDFTASIINNTNNVKLEWQAPQAPQGDGEWIHYDSGENTDGLGLSSGGSFIVAVKWDPDQLQPYEDYLLKQIKFFSRSAEATFEIRVWTGADAANLVYSQSLGTVTANTWTTVTLSTPIPVDNTQDLYVGYLVTHAAGDFPVGYEGLNPVVEGYSDLINTSSGGFESMTNYGYYLNWNLEAYVEYAGKGAYQPMRPLINEPVAFNPSDLRKGNLPKAASAVTENDPSLYGYVVYRDNTALTDTLPQTTLEYTDQNVPQGGHYYFVDALYKYGCNASSVEKYIDILTVINETEAGSLQVYPVPASDFLTVGSTEPVVLLELTSMTGAVVQSVTADNSNRVRLNTTNLPSGIYNLTVTTSTGKIVNKKVVIAK